MNITLDTLRRRGSRNPRRWVLMIAVTTLLGTPLVGCRSDERNALRATTTDAPTEYHSPRPPAMTFPPIGETTSSSSTPPTTVTPGPATPGSPRPSVSWPPYSPLPGVTGSAPLTGMAVDDATALLPIVAVKIDNTRSARGQWGLDGADVVFEENVEGITRFIAVFQSRQPVEVGPVRSARTGDLYILAGMNRPILGWSGGNANVTAWVQSAAAAGRLVNLSALKVRCYRRHSSRPRPHNLVLDMACARAKGTGAGPARPLWQFVDNTPAASPATTTTSATTIAGDPSLTTPGAATSTSTSLATPTSTSTPTLATTSTPATMSPGTPLTQFDVTMAGVRVRWVWDPTNRMWLRYQDGAVHVSAGNVPLRFTNVVVMHCQHIKSPAEPRSQVPVTVGSGRVEVYSDGQMRRGAWTRAADTDAWTFTADDGTAILLTPGTTFVELTRA